MPDAQSSFEADLHLKGRIWFPLFFRSPKSPLQWRELLVFSAACYLSRAKRRPVTRNLLATWTLLNNKSISGIVRELQSLDLLDLDLHPTEPDRLDQFFNLKRKTPVLRRWTDRIVYTRFYLPTSRSRKGKTDNLEPHHSCLLGFLYFKEPDGVSAHYIAVCTGISRRQVDTGLTRLTDLGFLDFRRSQKDNALLIKLYECDNSNLFCKAKSKSKPAVNLEATPRFLVELYNQEKIPLSYLGLFARLQPKFIHVYPYDWVNIINGCWVEHKSFKEKFHRPYPSKKMILTRVIHLNENRSKYA